MHTEPPPQRLCRYPSRLSPSLPPLLSLHPPCRPLTLPPSHPSPLPAKQPPSPNNPPKPISPSRRLSTNLKPLSWALPIQLLSQSINTASHAMHNIGDAGPSAAINPYPASTRPSAQPSSKQASNPPPPPSAPGANAGPPPGQEPQSITAPQTKAANQTKRA